MKIYAAKINHMVNPLGFRLDRTVFSWKVKEAKGTKQEYARIRVALDKDFTNLVFDSGEDTGADSLCYNASFPLEKRTRYFWNVEVKTDFGEKTVSDTQFFETGKLSEPWVGKWITCDSSIERHPVFVKNIDIKGEVALARLYICGLGLFEAFYNGKKIGDEYFTPFCNDYNTWLQYVTYDVTEELKESGRLSVMLGNGWYKGRFGFRNYENKGFYGNEWQLIAELRIKYSDGSEEVIGTDDSWDTERSRIYFSNIYDGEKTDMTLPDLPKEKAVSKSSPKAPLEERLSLPLKVHEIIPAKELIITPKGETVIDLGQEITGIFRLKAHVPSGKTVRIETGEVLQNGNFYNDNLRSAKSEYVYTSDGKETVIEPHFTFYGYRYAKIEGICDLKKEDFCGLAIYSEIEETGSVVTGHELINRFFSNVRWGLKCNFLDVPTDCPQRDERMGWTADTQVFTNTAMYLEDTYAFYKKYLYDMMKEQKVRNGMVPVVIPSAGVDSFTSSVWGDATCIIPWNMYLFYGDKSILEEHFESMRSWVDYIRRVDGKNHGWRDTFHYGDWLALDNPERGPETTKGATDDGYLANLYYALSAELTSKAAAVLNKTEEEKYYRDIFEEQIKEIRHEYYSSSGRCCIKTMTAMLLTLKYRLSDNETLIKDTLRWLLNESGHKLRTGFVGTPIICNVLTENGMGDIAYELLLNEEYPGWLYEVKLGATTVWERWNSLLQDGTISGTSMNSLNHYAYGSVMEWVFRHVAGLNTIDSAPGCRVMHIEPLLNYELKKVTGTYDSPSGKYMCEWELIDRKHVKIAFEVPFGGSAYVTLPNAPFEVQNRFFEPAGPGHYEVTYELTAFPGEKLTTESSLIDYLRDERAADIIKDYLPVEKLKLQKRNNSIKMLVSYYRGSEAEKILKEISERTARLYVVSGDGSH